MKCENLSIRKAIVWNLLNAFNFINFEKNFLKFNFHVQETGWNIKTFEIDHSFVG